MRRVPWRSKALGFAARLVSRQPRSSPGPTPRPQRLRRVAPHCLHRQWWTWRVLADLLPADLRRQRLRRPPLWALLGLLQAPARRAPRSQPQLRRHRVRVSPTESRPGASGSGRRRRPCRATRRRRAGRVASDRATGTPLWKRCQRPLPPRARCPRRRSKQVIPRHPLAGHALPRGKRGHRFLALGPCPLAASRGRRPRRSGSPRPGSRSARSSCRRSGRRTTTRSRTRGRTPKRRSPTAATSMFRGGATSIWS
mmetsp:Transcript_12258/g.39275  ORF Transcript_12258/g.39275 Transcript_12258/m.39275 type:complete len:254 (-) Transcript_12258:326-1087(-)